MFPLPVEFLPTVFVRCCRFSAPSDRPASGSWQVPVLVPTDDGAGLQHPQDGRPWLLLPSSSTLRPSFPSARWLTCQALTSALSYNTFVVHLGLLSPSTQRSCRRLRLVTAPLTGVVGCLLRHPPLSPDDGRPTVLPPHGPQTSLPRLGPAFCSPICLTAAAFGIHFGVHSGYSTNCWS